MKNNKRRSKIWKINLKYLRKKRKNCNKTSIQQNKLILWKFNKNVKIITKKVKKLKINSVQMKKIAKVNFRKIIKTGILKLINLKKMSVFAI